jgi:hypothetical protein
VTVLENGPRTLTMVPYDYFAPWVNVTLVTQEKEFPLWQGTGFIEDGGAAAVKFEGTNLAVLQEVLIEWQGAFYQMTINLSPNYDDAIKIVDSYLIQQGKTQVKVEMGFRNGQTQQFNGLVTSVDFSIGTEISLVLKTVPPPMSTVASQHTDQSNQSNPFNNKSPFDIITELWTKRASTAGFQYKVEVVPGDDDAAIKKLKTKLDSWSLGSKTVWTAIMQLVTNCFCVALVDGPILRIDSQLNSIGTLNPVATFQLFSDGTIGGDTRSYPITSASLKTSELFARTLQGINLQGTDLDTGEAVTRTAGTPDADDTGATVGAQTKGEGRPGGGPSPETSSIPSGGARPTQAQDPNSDRDRDNALRRALANWQQQGIQLEIESLLIPHLLPQQTIDVTGLGGRIDGRYWITKLFFQVGPDGGLTRFECIKTGVRFEDGQVAPLAGKVNEAPEPEIDDSTEASAESEG